jgi:hypothetical protein
LHKSQNPFFYITNTNYLSISDKFCSMQASSVDTLKAELKTLPPKKVLELLLRLTRFKKENKELLTYLLFESHNIQGYIEQIKMEITEAFEELDNSRAYKKGFRKIQRMINKPIKYMGNRMATVELYLFMAEKIKEQKKSLFTRSFLDKTLHQYIGKIEKLLPLVDEDLRHDVKRQLSDIYPQFAV